MTTSLTCTKRHAMTPSTTPRRTRVTPRAGTVTMANRREFGAQLVAIGMGCFLGFAGKAGAAADAGAAGSNSSSSNSNSSISSITITPINREAKALLDRRDEAMEYKCKGGMFDCDGDRRDFAHKQWMDWLESGGVPKRIRDGRPAGPRSF